MRVLIVDDSAVARQTLSLRLREPGLETQVAPTLEVARHRLQAARYDAVILDLELGRRTGDEPEGMRLLGELIAKRIPVIVCSALTASGTELAVRALALGASEVVDKAHAFGDPRLDLALLVTALGRRADSVAPPAAASLEHAPRAGLRVVGVGSSTGGIEPLRLLVSAQRDGDPPLAVAQHIAPAVLPSFLRHLQSVTGRPVVEVTRPTPMRSGHVYLAGPGRHLEVRLQAGLLLASGPSDPPVRHHRPSVDVLFKSIAESAGDRAAVFVLSGMSGDGGDGVAEVSRAGGLTVAQDEESSVVYGMARDAVDRGVVEAIVPMDALADVMRAALDGRGGAGLRGEALRR